MDGITIQAKIKQGYAKTAAIIGQSHTQYRPLNALNPFLIPLGAVEAIFTVNTQFKQAKPDQILWTAMVNGTVQTGDYLVGTNTWAMLQTEPLMPLLAMRCTDTISSMARVAEEFTTLDGAGQSETILAQNVPCYVNLKRDKGFGAPKDFPGGTDTSAPLPEWLVYVALGGVYPSGFFQDGDLLSIRGEQWRVDAASSDTVMWQLACTAYIPNA
jgi:hypothetical protein